MFYSALCVKCGEKVAVNSCPNCESDNVWKRTHKDLEEAATKHAYSFFQCEKCGETFDTFVHGCGGETMAKYFLSPVGRVWYLLKSLLMGLISGCIFGIIAGFAADWLAGVVFCLFFFGFGVIEPGLVLLGKKNPMIMAK